MRYLFPLLFLMFPVNVHAITSISQSTSFPFSMPIDEEIYQLTENIICDGTCFNVSGENITIDLNGYTITFDNANNPRLDDPGMENWTDSTTPEDWTVQSGTATQSSAIMWGDYDAVLSATAQMRSETVTLNADKSYVYYAMIKGESDDSYTVAIHDAGDNSVLATSTISGAHLNRGFAMTDGAIGTTEHQYKPTSNVDVYLLITCSGSSTKRLHYADIKPGKTHGIVSYTYQNTNYFPDGPSSGWGASPGLTIQNGSIVQGDGESVKAAAIFHSGSIVVSNVNVAMAGNNTAALITNGSDADIDDMDTTTTNLLMLNRMHPTACIDLGDITENTVEIQNCTFVGDPEMVIRSYGQLDSGEVSASVSIHDNIFQNKEQVTEGYAIAFSGVYGADIYNNDFSPTQGRGILLDAVGFGSLDGTKNITIRNNTFNLYEVRNIEYPETSLECAGIRIRHWGGASERHEDIAVYDNTINISTDASGVHAAYGINISSPGDNDSVEIFNNVFSIDVSGPGYWGAALAVQNNSAATSTYIFRNNFVTSNSYGIGFSGNDGSDAHSWDIYLNDITAAVAPIRFGMSTYTGTIAGINMYCNKLNNTGAAGNPFYFNGAISAVAVDYNQITNSNSSGYEAWADEDESADILFCNSGTIDVDGGGLVGATGACSNGSANCYESAGILVDDTPGEPPDSGGSGCFITLP